MGAYIARFETCHVGLNPINANFGDMRIMGRPSLVHLERYGRLSYVGPSEKSGKSIWKCDCGSDAREFYTSNVRRGLSGSCGCLHREKASKRTMQVSEGDRYGELTIIREVQALTNNGARRKSTVRRVLAKCSCGVEDIYRLSNLRTGHTTTCGHLVATRKAEYSLGERLVAKSDGRSKDKLYRRYYSMIHRITDSSDLNYHRYGGRGIKICDEWLGAGGFESYREFILSLDGYCDGMEIDRIDNDGDYAPDNIKLSTRSDQTRNTSQSRWWWVDGVRYAASIDAAKRHNVDTSTIHNWCGLRVRDGKAHGARKGCYSELKYPEPA